MRTIYLDCRKMTSKAAAHEYVAEMLGFPKYYGRNLDALYDCLTDMIKCKVIFTSVEELCKANSYASKAVAVFLDAAKENKNLKVEF